MLKHMARAGWTLVGAALGPTLVVGLNNLLIYAGSADLTKLLLPGAMLAIYLVCAVVFGIIFFMISPKIINRLTSFTKRIEQRLVELPAADVLFGVVGLMIGLVIALLLCAPIARIPIYWLSVVLSVIVYIIFGYLGWAIAVKRRGELNPMALFRRAGRDKSKGSGLCRPKVLDTSVIIDGRILDICKTGIIEGDLIIPAFVLRELRHIADSSDAIKRNRGRRGLDILNGLQKEQGFAVVLDEKDYDDIAEVDLKLLRLGEELGGVVVTNDFNLNKVAEVQGVPVLNINDLSNAVRSVLLPGEELDVQIIKEGKESGQGVAYLADGTMIVVDNGRKYIGADAHVMVTSVLQTSAGKMIFAKLEKA